MSPIEFGEPTVTVNHDGCAALAEDLQALTHTSV